MNVPVVVVFFNRLDPLRRLVARLAELRPPRVYLISDGARFGRDGESVRVAECREFMSRLPWTCEVKRNFSERNMGCSDRIYSGLNWVFEQETEAIVIEDDCLPVPAFFDYAEKALERYRDDERVMSICGSNPAAGSVPVCDGCGFSKYPMVWGWATWRRAWRKMDYGLKSCRGLKRFMMIRRQLGAWRPALYWHYLLSRPSPSWDYRWAFSCFKNKGLNLLPSARLVDNVGMTPDSTHTAYNPYDLPAVDGIWRCPDVFPTSVASLPTLDRWIDDHVFSRSFFERIKWAGRKVVRLSMLRLRKVEI